MRQTLLLLVVSAALTHPTHGQSASVIFREISIQPYGTITLGAPLDPSPVLSVLENGAYLLPPGFGGTTGIVVFTTADTLVAALMFVYPADYSFEASIAEYQASLGSGLRQRGSSSSGGVAVECAVWQDDYTRFELTKGGDRGETLTVSVIVDVAVSNRTSEGCHAADAIAAMLAGRVE